MNVGEDCGFREKNIFVIVEIKVQDWWCLIREEKSGFGLVIFFLGVEKKSYLENSGNWEWVVKYGEFG